MEVCLNRAWGSVCGVFDRLDAIVFCNQLEGFTGESTGEDGRHARGYVNLHLTLIVSNALYVSHATKLLRFV